MAIPDPQLGLVVSYSYLWRHEHNAGRDEGLKNRPCVIVLSIRRPTRDVVTVRVAPITHSPPANLQTSFELPPAIKQHLGLDTERSWVILDEINEFPWPGYDLRPIGKSRDRYAYGVLPPRLFNSMLEKLGTVWRAGLGKTTPRD